MKSHPKLLAFMLLAGLTVAASTLSFARRSVTGEVITVAPERNGERMIEHLTKILADTDCPLTDEQITALNNIEFGPGSRGEVRDILTGEQHTILAESRPERPRGRDDGDRGRFRPGGMHDENRIEHVGKILNDAGQPLTPEQMDQLAALEPGPESRGRMHEILTEEQAAILHENRPPRREGEGFHRDRRKGGRQGMMIGKILEDAGQPLTDEQKEQLDALVPEKIIREKIESFLTDEQKEALEKARGNAPVNGRGQFGRPHSPEMLFEVLEDSGYPSSDAQKTAIKELGTGRGHRTKLMELLTDEQRDALKAAAREHRGRGRGKDRSGYFQGLHHKSANVQQGNDSKPKSALLRSGPNTANPVTTISFQTQKASHVTLDIYTIEGQRVRTLVDNYVSAGSHSVAWNGTDDNGQQVSTGNYYYTVNTGTQWKYTKWFS